MATLARLSVDLVANSGGYRKELDKAGRATARFKKRANKAFREITKAVGLMAGAMALAGAGTMIKLADQMQNLKNRMFALTKDTKKTAIAMRDIATIARVTRSDIAATGDVYTKMAIATADLGINQEELAKATAAVNNTFLLSGASTLEAANSARQLAQGLAAGRLNGDELRSVMENNAVLAGELAKGFNVTRGELKQMGADGKLTAAKIMPILIKAFDSTSKSVATMEMTVSQAATTVKNRFTEMAVSADKSLGFTKTLATGLDLLGKNLEVFATQFIYTIAIPAIVALGFAIKSLTVIIMANPIGAALTLLVIAFGYAARKIHENWSAVSEFLFKSFTLTLPNAFDRLRMGIQKMQLAIEKVFNKILKNIADFINKGIKLYNEAAAKFSFLDAIPPLTLTVDTETTISNIDKLKAAILARTAGFKPLEDALGIKSSGGVPGEQVNEDGSPDFGEAGADAAGVTPSGLSTEKLESMTIAAETMRGAFEDMAQPISNVFTNIIKGVTSLSDGLKNIASMILDKVIGSFVEMGVNWVLQQTLMKAMEVAGIATSVATSVAAGSAMAAAYAPAAAMASLASFGANAAPASAGIIATTAVAKTMAIAGQAHDGIDSVPREGTYLLDKGERVVDSRLNGDLKQFLGNSNNNQVTNNPTLNFNVNGSDAENVEAMLRNNRGQFEGMIREIYNESAQNSPF